MASVATPTPSRLNRSESGNYRGSSFHGSFFAQKTDTEFLVFLPILTEKNDSDSLKIGGSVGSSSNLMISAFRHKAKTVNNIQILILFILNSTFLKKIKKMQLKNAKLKKIENQLEFKKKNLKINK